MSNKTSFINKTVTLNAELSFDRMEILERVLKEAYMEAATSNDVSGLEVLNDLGGALGVDAEINLDEAMQPALQEVE